MTQSSLLFSSQASILMYICTNIYFPCPCSWRPEKCTSLKRVRKQTPAPPSVSKQPLTLTVSIHLLMANTADAVAQRYQPGSVGTAVQFRRVPFFRVLHTRAPHLHERGRVHVWHRVGERRKVPQSGWAAFVEHLATENTRLVYSFSSCVHISYPSVYRP